MVTRIRLLAAVLLDDDTQRHVVFEVAADGRGGPWTVGQFQLLQLP